MSSNTKKIIILVVIILVLSALLSSVCGISTLGIRLFKSHHSGTAENWTPQGNFSEIEAESSTSDIRILPSENGKASIEWSGRPGSMKLEVKVRNGKLSVEEKHRFPLFRFFSISSGKSVITVYLPQKSYSGIDVQSDTGDISVRGLSAQKLSMESDTGNIEANHVTVSGSADLQTDVGRLDLTDVTCGKLDVRTDTGSIGMKNVLISGALTAKSDVGSIRLDRCDAASLDLKTDTGSITGTLLSSKVFITRTDIGNVSVPSTTAGGTCRAETSIGSINLTIVR